MALYPRDRGFSKPAPRAPVNGVRGATSFGNYTGRVAGGRVGNPLAHTADKPRVPKVTLEQQANKLVNQLIDAQLGPLLQSQAHDRAVGQAFALAIGNLLKSDQSQASSIWSGIGSDLGSALGSSNAAFSDALAQGKSSVGADLAAIGAPQEQQQQAVNQLNQDFGLNQAMANAPLTGGQGIAAAYASQTPTAANEFLGNALFGDANAAYQDYQARQQLEATRPQLMQQVLGQLQSAQNDQATLALKQQQAALNQWAAQQLAGYRASETKAAQGRLNVSRRNSNTSAYNAQTSRQRAATSAAQGNARIAQGNVRLQQGQERLTLAQRREALAEAKAAQSKTAMAKKPRFTPLETQRYKGTSETLASNARQGFTDSGGTQHPPLSYAAAIEEARKEGLPLSIFVPILNRYYAPGEAGRPQVKIPRPKNMAHPQGRKR